MQIFSNRLVSLRKEHGMTQDDMAKISNKGRSTISGYERGEKEPDLETVCFFANYFEVSTDYLLGRTNERKQITQTFYADKMNFEHYFRSTPPELRPALEKCFDGFYKLLAYDMQIARPERLRLYGDLLQKLQSFRGEIRKGIEISGGAITDPVILSDLMAMQSQLKNEVASLLDKLVQADMEIAFSIKNNTSGSSEQQAI